MNHKSAATIVVLVILFSLVSSCSYFDPQKAAGLGLQFVWTGSIVTDPPAIHMASFDDPAGTSHPVLGMNDIPDTAFLNKVVISEPELRIYFITTEDNAGPVYPRIRRINYEGGDLEELYFLPEFRIIDVRSIAVDGNARLFFFTGMRDDQKWGLYSVPTDSYEAPHELDLIDSGEYFDITLDRVNRYVYFSRGETGFYKVNYDGGGLESEYLQMGDFDPPPLVQQISLDKSGNTLYFTDSTAGIFSVNAQDGHDGRLIEPEPDIDKIAVDSITNRIFYLSTLSESIWILQEGDLPRIFFSTDPNGPITDFAIEYIP